MPVVTLQQMIELYPISVAADPAHAPILREVPALPQLPKRGLYVVTIKLFAMRLVRFLSPFK